MGGAGGAGGSGSYASGSSGAGGAGGAGVSGSGFTLTNTGAIHGGSGGAGTGDGAGGVGVVSTGNSTIYNNGTISGGMSGDGATRASAIELSGGNNTLVLQSGSSITGYVVSSSGSSNGGDTLAVGGTTNAAFDLSTTSTDASQQYQSFYKFAKEGSSTWALSGSGTFAGGTTVSGGSLQLLDGVSLTSNVAVQLGAMLGSDDASITGHVTNSGTLSIGNSTTPARTLTVTGDYTQSSGGVFKTTVSSNSSFGKLTVTGTANISGSASVNVLTVNTLAAGQTLSGVVSAGTLSGNFSGVIDNSALFNFTSVLNGNQIDLAVSAASTAGVSDSVSATGMSPATGAARVLDSWISSGPATGDISTVTTAFGQLETQQQVSQAATQTLPLLSAGGNAAIANLQHQVQTVFQNRMSGLRGLSSGDGELSDGKLWAKAFGSRADQDDHQSVAGYDANSWGLVFGGDGQYNPSTRIGAAFSFAKTAIDGSASVSGTSHDANIGSYQLSLYSSHDLEQGSFVDVQFDVGQSNVEGKRHISFGGLNRTAKSDYDALFAHAGVALGKTLNLSEATSFTPSVRADYAWVRSESYTETGAGALNLNVDSDTSAEFILGVDGRLNHRLSENARLTASVGVGYDLINDQSSLTSAYAGSPGLSFRTYGQDQSPWLVRGGLGVVINKSGGFEFSLAYDVEGRKDFLNQTASAKAKWAF